MEISWVIEEWIPPENAIGDTGYWVEISEGQAEMNAHCTVRKLAGAGRRVQLVKVTREVVR